MFERSRIGLLSLWLMASIVACGGPASAPAPPVLPAPTTTTTAVAAVYLPTNPETVATVERFLTAEIAGDFQESFTLLAESDQEAAGGVEGWVADHYLVLPTILGYRLTDDTVDDGTAEVSADLTLQAGLDELVGLIPGAAEATWVVVDEAGEWRIGFTESRIDPIFLDDDGAPAAVSNWANERLTCDPEPDSDALLLGFPMLADGLCGATGAVTVGGPGALDDAADAAPFLAAYGPEVGIWARVVEVQTPVALRVVVAPIGEQWEVIGVLEN